MAERTEGVITCPYCGHEYDDCKNRADKEMDGVMDCVICEREFAYVAVFTILWKTTEMHNAKLTGRETGRD